MFDENSEISLIIFMKFQRDFVRLNTELSPKVCVRKTAKIEFGTVQKFESQLEKSLEKSLRYNSVPVL